jgi:hypothetical protein
MPHIHRRPVQLPLDLMTDIRERISTPGPGFYSLTSRLKAGVRFALSPRSRSLFPNCPEETPGCIYKQDSNLVHRSASPVRFSRSPRQSTDPPDYGGVSYTEAKSTLSRRAHSFAASRSAYRAVYFPGSDRERLGRTSRTISTSRGSSKTARSGRSFTRSPRTQSHSFSSVGPGQYDPTIPRPTIGHAVRFGSPRRRSRLEFSLLDQFSKTYWSM